MGCDPITDENGQVTTLVSPLSPPCADDADASSQTVGDVETGCEGCLEFKLRGMYDGECDCNIYGGCAVSLDISNAEIDVSKYEGECFIELTFGYHVVLGETVDQEFYVLVELSSADWNSSTRFVYLKVPAGGDEGSGTKSVDLTNLSDTDTSLTVKFTIIKS